MLEPDADPWCWLRDQLRDQIVQGRYPHGSRLPSRRELASAWRCSPVTLHKAIQTLMAEGFLVAKPRQGTFIVDRPPHRHRFAVIFDAPVQPTARGRNPWTGFFHAIHLSLAEVASERQCDWQCNHAFSDAPEDFSPLVRSLRSRCLAGAISALDLDFLPSFRQACHSLPLVAIGSHLPVGQTNIVLWDASDMLRQVFRRLATVVRRRVVLLDLLSDDAAQRRSDLLALARTCGLEVASEDLLLMAIGDPDEHAVAVRLLVQRSGVPPPQALLILNDNLLDGAARGVNNPMASNDGCRPNIPSVEAPFCWPR